MKNKILLALLERYYNSKSYKGENAVNQNFSITPDLICKSYGDNYHRKETEKFDDACSELAAMKFIILDKKPQGAILSVKLNKDYIREVEAYLESISSFVAKGKIINRLQNLINNTDLYNQYADAYIHEIQEKINKNAKNYPDEKEVEDMIKVLNSLTSIKEETYIREYSQMIFGNTKTFEDNYLSKTCSFLLSNFDFVIDDENKKEKVLENFNILSNPGYVYLKGNIEIVIDERCLNLSSLHGFALCDKDFANISSIKIHDENMITIENLTSFNRFSEIGYSCIYLGGYHNECRRNLLKLIYKNNSLIRYYHCGDIDAGGLYIFEHLKQKTNIPFLPYRMDTQTLSNEQYRSALIPLTISDIKRLNVMKDNGLHNDLIEYMIQKNCKLEQEMITMINSRK